MQISLNEKYFLNNSEVVTVNAIFSENNTLFAAVSYMTNNHKQVVGTNILSKTKTVTKNCQAIVELTEEGELITKVEYQANQQMPGAVNRAVSHILVKTEEVSADEV